MTDFVLHRNRTIACSSGHIIAFVKGEPTYVPPPAIAECMAAGAVPTTELPEEKVPDIPVAPTDPNERQRVIIDAIEKLRARGERGDFDASGRPHPKAISAIVGFTVDARERNKAWDVYTEAESGN